MSTVYSTNCRAGYHALCAAPKCACPHHATTGVDKLCIDARMTSDDERSAALMERRDRIMAEQFAPQPAEATTETMVEQLVRLIHHAITTKGDAA